MIIGNFTYDKQADSYYGEIQTFTLQRGNVTIQPSGMTGEREPAYRVVIASEAGEVELGAAWRKTSDRGVRYLSIVLDDPAFPARCDAALFMNAEERTAQLVWQRPRAAPAPAPSRPGRSGARPGRRAAPPAKPQAG